MSEDKLNEPDLEHESRGFFGRLKGDIDDLYSEGKISVNGCSFITHLTSMYWGVRGIPENLLDLAMPVLLIEVLKCDTDTGTTISSLVFVPWAMKPFFAILSDTVVFAHFKKRWYMVLVAVLGSCCCWLVAFSTPEFLGLKTANTAFLLMFCVNTAIAMCDSLSQGKYTEICKWKGSTVVSYVSASKVASGTIGAFVGPTINDTAGPQTNFAIIIGFLGQAAVVFAGNFMGDRKTDECCSVDRALIKKDYKIITTGLALGVIALTLPVLRILDLSDFLLPVTTGGILVVLSLTFWALPPAVAKINVYIILCRICALDFRYVLQQWYTSASVQCGEDTPHFPNTVYQMVGLVTGNLMTLFGVYLFENYVYYWNAQKAFWVTTGFTMIAALFDLSMLTGFNRKIWDVLPFLNMSRKTTFLCVPCEDADLLAGACRSNEWKTCEPDGYRFDDVTGFLMGSQGIKAIATTLDDMPSTILLSKLCPAGVETTVFAILAALMNLGLTFSGLLAKAYLKLAEVNIGSEIYQFPGYSELLQNPDTNADEWSWVPARTYVDKLCELGVSPLGRDNRFTSNPELPYGDGEIEGLHGIAFGLVLGGIILPSLTIPLTFLLIPNQPLNEPFIGDGEEPREMTEDGMPGGVSHPAAAFSKHSPSFDPLNAPAGQLASQAELEKSASLMFQRGGMGASRLL